MVQIIMVDSPHTRSAKGLPVLQSNVAEGFWEEKMGKTLQSETLAFTCIIVFFGLI